LRILSLCFFISGFCSLLYQTVWLRLASAAYGVNAPLLASVLSVFMLGLMAGSVWGKSFSDHLQRNPLFRNLRAYAFLEFLIGLGGLSVPAVFQAGRTLLLSVPMSSGFYFAGSFLAVAAALFPFCFVMGATVPAALDYLNRAGVQSPHHFSRLYLMNVLGGVAGVAVTAIAAIELLGFRGTLGLGVILNFAAAGLAWIYGGRTPAAVSPPRDAALRVPRPVLLQLFLLGFCSLGIEVLWTRLYLPFTGSLVYAFAGILGIYLVATTFGTAVYRRYFLRKRNLSYVWAMLAPAALLSLTAVHPAYPFPVLARLVLGIAPLSFLLGILTPSLIDVHSQSNAAAAGKSYAVNLAGCILGPLAAGFVFIPWVGNYAAYLIFAAVFLLLTLGILSRLQKTVPKIAFTAAVLMSCALILKTGGSYESQYPDGEIRHDYAATVVAAGKGMKKQLLVNGTGMTLLSTITKLMVHLPAAHLPEPPQKTLVIGLGMGTSFRSLLSWNADVTAVELVPSVAALLPYYFPDAPKLLEEAGDKARIVIDDGRRYLDRHPAQYDLIIIDPPPPIEAAGSSLLYSKEMYGSVKKRLKKDGILQTWIAGVDQETTASILRSVAESFTSMRLFDSIDGWGLHILASDSPIPMKSPAELAAALPERVRQDLTEWLPKKTAEAIFIKQLEGEFPTKHMLSSLRSGKHRLLTDDFAVNEYFLWRKVLRPRLTGSAQETRRTTS
jgi:spermidine synthase